VLIIDDEVEVRWSIQSLLKAAGLRSESFWDSVSSLRPIAGVFRREAEWRESC